MSGAYDLEMSEVIQQDRIYSGDDGVVIVVKGDGFATDDKKDYSFAFQLCRKNPDLDCWEWLANDKITGELLSKKDQKTIAVAVSVASYNTHTGCHRLVVRFQGDEAVITDKSKQWVRIDVPVNHRCPASECDGRRGCDYLSKRREKAREEEERAEEAEGAPAPK